MFICSILNKRIQSEIDVFFSKLYSFPEELRLVSASAFTQCRDKISYTAFRQVHKDLVSYFYDCMHFKCFYGMRLIAIDGTTFTLPKTKETVREFGDNVLSEHGKWIKAKVSFATDVLNNICVQACIGSYKSSEGKQARQLIDHMDKNNLYLFDRGYFTWNFFEYVVSSGSAYCFRVKRNACKQVELFVNQNDNDVLVNISIPKGKTIKVRLVKIRLSSGEQEYLLTSLLDRKRFSLNKLKHLYHLRWSVEEQYKDVKHALSIENFTGKKVNSIKQEFYANILTYNLSMMMCKPVIDKAMKKKKARYKYKTNKRALIAKVKQCFVKLFFHPETLIETVEQIIISVARESVPIRKGRKYERSKSYKAKLKFSRAYTSVV